MLQLERKKQFCFNLSAKLSDFSCKSADKKKSSLTYPQWINKDNSSLLELQVLCLQVNAPKYKGCLDVAYTLIC